MASVRGKAGQYKLLTDNSRIDGLVLYSEYYDTNTNTSNLNIALKLHRADSYQGITTVEGDSKFSVKCNGQTMNITIPANTMVIPQLDAQTMERPYVEVFYKTFSNISHNSDGTKTVEIEVSGTLKSCQGTTDIKLNNFKQNVALTTIPKVAKATATGVDFGNPISINVTRPNDDLTYSLSYKCGSLSGILRTKTKEINTQLATTTEWSKQNINGMTVDVVLTVQTYSGDTLIGESTTTVVCGIPVYTPEASIAITDGVTLPQTYSNEITNYIFLKGKSKARVKTTHTSKWGSTIKSCTVTCEGKTYTGIDVTTDVINVDGKITITLVDSRGRSFERVITIPWVEYFLPQITVFTAKRQSLVNGKYVNNNEGEYVLINVKAQAFVKNKRLYYKLQKGNSDWDKDNNGASWTNIIADGSTTNQTVELSARFQLAKSNAAKIRIVLTDDLNAAEPTIYSIIVGMGHTFMNAHPSGEGVSFGEMATEQGIMSTAYPFRHKAGFMREVLDKNVDLNTLLTPNRYVSTAGRTYTNSPVRNSFSWVLDVIPAGDGAQAIQRLTVARKEDSKIYERHYHCGEGDSESCWGTWKIRSDQLSESIRNQEPRLLWNGENGNTNGLLMTSGESITLSGSKSISNQATGYLFIFALVQSINDDTVTATNGYYITQHFVHKAMPKVWNSSICIPLSYACNNFVGTKNIKIAENTSNGEKTTTIEGNIMNVEAGTQSGISYDNKKFALKYIYGV